jgi:hypothetical protein
MTEIQDEIASQENIEPEDVDSGVLMETPFDPREINIGTKPLNIDLLIKRLKAVPSEIDLTSEFQRNNDLWSNEQQSRLIESLLIQIPLPAFYFDGTDENKWLVVDGLQRLSAIRNFTVEKTLKLTGMEFLDQLNGKGFDDLPRSSQRKIEETQITAYIINPGTPENVKYNLFKRLNTGGFVLKPQEIRNALNQGIPARFVENLTNTKEFKQATGEKVSSKRMLDRDFVMRFIAFYLSPISEYKPDMDTYLNEKMGKIKELSDKERESMKNNFITSMKLSTELFGDAAFRKIIQENNDKRINKALFEVWSVKLSKLTDDEQIKLVKNKQILLANFIQVMNENRTDNEFMHSITTSTGHKARVTCRHSKIDELVKGVLAI